MIGMFVKTMASIRRDLYFVVKVEKEITLGAQPDSTATFCNFQISLNCGLHRETVFRL